MGSKRIGIVGLGLIGGSLGLDLQKLGHEVYGIANRKENAVRAKERGLAQFISTSPNLLSNCSIIILALPLPQLLNPKSDLITALPINAVITDVGSVKKPVLDRWRELHPRFVASHPMAGTIENGVEAGQPQLFKSKPWIATPEAKTDMTALKEVKALATSLGSKWISTDAETHDEAVALISHLPVFISAALIKAVSHNRTHELLDLTKAIASSGFKDTSRVGGGNPALGVAMATNNTYAVLDALKAYRSTIEELEKIIRAKQWKELEQELQDTQKNRSDFL